MRLRDYFRGIPVTLQSGLSASTVVDRINDAAGSIFWPFNTGAVGGVRFGRVSLRYRSSPMEYNAKPILVGRLRDDALGSVLTLRYRAPIVMYVFLPFWYAFLTLFGLLLLSGLAEGDPDKTIGAWAAMLGIWSVLLIFPLGMHYVGTRNSDEELSELLDFLARQAEATPPKGLQPPHPRQS